MAEYGREQRNQLSRVIANSGTKDLQMKEFVDNRVNVIKNIIKPIFSNNPIQGKFVHNGNEIPEDILKLITDSISPNAHLYKMYKKIRDNDISIEIRSWVNEKVGIVFYSDIRNKIISIINKLDASIPNPQQDSSFTDDDMLGPANLISLPENSAVKGLSVTKPGGQVLALGSSSLIKKTIIVNPGRDHEKGGRREHQETIGLMESVNLVVGGKFSENQIQKYLLLKLSRITALPTVQFKFTCYLKHDPVISIFIGGQIDPSHYSCTINHIGPMTTDNISDTSVVI